jgi:hypothetical protein
MLNHAVANPVIETTTPVIPDPRDPQPAQPSAFGRISNVFATARNRVTHALLDKMLPDTLAAVDEEIGCVVEYEGDTLMVEPSKGRMGLEIQNGDMIFVNSDGVWFGLTHYDEMPVEIETYNFITSGSRTEYNALVEAKLENDLQRQRDVQAFLMAA